MDDGAVDGKFNGFFGEAELLTVIGSTQLTQSDEQIDLKEDLWYRFELELKNCSLTSESFNFHVRKAK